MRSTTLSLVTLALFAALALSLAACGGGSSSTGSEAAATEETEGSTESTTSTEEAEGSEDGSTKGSSTPLVGGKVVGPANSLPTELKEQFAAYPPGSAKSPYADFKAVKGPWKVCYSESYLGNPWRVNLQGEVERIAKQYEEAGLVSSFTATSSDEDVARQNQQIRQFVDQGCDVIFVIPNSETGINAAIKDAYDHGVPVVSIAATVTSPYAENIDNNFYRLGAQLAQNTNEVGGPILMVNGIEGTSVAEAEKAGAKAQWAAEGGADIASEVFGNYTASVTKQVTTQALATNPSEIAAVWTPGSESVQVAESFEQAGRPLPLITASISTDALGYWKEHEEEFKFDGFAQMPSWTAGVGWRVGMKILAGQQPQITPVLVPMPLVKQEDLADLWEPCMTPTSTDKFPVVKEDPLPEKSLDAYFKTSGAVGPYDYAETPKPCE